MTWYEISNLPIERLNKLHSDMSARLDDLSADELCELCFVSLYVSIDPYMFESFVLKLVELSSDEANNSKLQSKVLYLRGCLARHKELFDESYSLLQQAVIIGAGEAVEQFAKFRIASNLMEEGRIHLASQKLNALNESPNTHSAIKDMVNSSLSMMLVELGLLEQYRQLELSESGKIRRELIFSFLRGETNYAKKLLKHGSEMHSLSQHDEPDLLILSDLFIGYSILDYQAFVKDVSKSWVLEFIIPYAETSYYGRLLALATSQKFKASEKYTSSWITRIREYMFDILLCANTDSKSDATTILKSMLSPYMRELHLMSPMIPYLMYGYWFPDNLISNSLSKQLALKPTGEPSTEYLAVGSKEVTFVSEANRLSRCFRKSTSSLAVLRVMAGPAGSFVSNSELYKALYLDDYDQYVNGKRLYKVLERLQKRLCEAGFPILWKRPGDGTVVNEYDIILN